MTAKPSLHRALGLTDAEYDLIVRLGGEESWYVGDGLRHAAQDALAKRAYLKAAANYERAMLRCLQTNTGFLETGAYLVVPHMVHRYRARGLLAAGKLDEARKETALCLAALPGHVELPILLVPELEKRAMKKDADELFNRTFGTLEKQCADYPKSAWARNNLAWLTACCRRQLDKGLDHSREAVKLAPNNAGYLDTLAEVHFQRGDRDQALQLMKKCIELDPKNRYFRDQLKRFEAGDPKAPLPESPDNE